MKLVYRGAIDDNARSAEEVEKPYLENAITELAAGKSISQETSIHSDTLLNFRKRSDFIIDLCLLKPL
jgi:hypothetical protein